MITLWSARVYGLHGVDGYVVERMTHGNVLLYAAEQKNEGKKSENLHFGNLEKCSEI